MPEIRERIPNSEIPATQTEKKLATGMIDLQKDREATVPREVKTWMQKVEEDPNTNNQNQKTKSDDDLIMQPIATTVTKITLPSDKKSFTTGFSKPVDSAWRWFSAFVLRVIKKNQGNVKFKEE